MKTYRGEMGYLHRSRPRQLMELSGQLHAPAALPPWKYSRYPLARRLGGIRSRSERCGEETISFPLELIPGRQARRYTY
jgi:hypothetical protein